MFSIIANTTHGRLHATERSRVKERKKNGKVRVQMNLPFVLEQANESRSSDTPFMLFRIIINSIVSLVSYLLLYK